MRSSGILAYSFCGLSFSCALQPTPLQHLALEALLKQRRRFCDDEEGGSSHQETEEDAEEVWIERIQKHCP